ncbi:MAG: hypothetical protein MZW92_06755 [Comamonadaceae bacterium]|nr:hypothetical protein [Comamonadaceae bacterium]
MMATDEASLAWIANLACIEIHQMHCRSPHFNNPDYFVFDLDPPENTKFGDIAGIALDMKKHIEDFGYRPFVKTSRRKGLHIVVPIEPKWTFGEVFGAVRDVAEPFVASRNRLTTLDIRKDARKGGCWWTSIATGPIRPSFQHTAYEDSPGAPVSMPCGGINW